MADRRIRSGPFPCPPHYVIVFGRLRAVPDGRQRADPMNVQTADAHRHERELVQRRVDPSGSAIRRVAEVEAGRAVEGVVGGAERRDSVLVAFVAVGDKTSGP